MLVAILTGQTDFTIQRTLEDLVADPQPIQCQLRIISGDSFGAVQRNPALHQKRTAAHVAGNFRHIHFIIFELNINPQFFQWVKQ